ncbi:metalloreductase STEAP4-like [Panulirus ornatus]|uniref:metalloreductase STEAP4-like n=1 Tax=Panulirus ornatus TaxID=150431 RepID=UPI003A84F97E
MDEKEELHPTEEDAQVEGQDSEVEQQAEGRPPTPVGDNDELGCRTPPVPLNLGNITLHVYDKDSDPRLSQASSTTTSSSWSAEWNPSSQDAQEDANPRISWDVEPRDDDGRESRPTTGDGFSLATTAFSPYDPRYSLSASYSLHGYSTLPIGEDGKKRLVVLGSGDFGLALTARLVQANYSVVVASRNPEKNRSKVNDAGGMIMTQAEAMQQSNLVVVAVPFQHVSSLPLSVLSNKILVDVSNRNPKTRDPSQRSQAEHLQALVPTARVVKAFNVLSAYTLSRGIRGSKEVPVCSDNDLARAVVCVIVRDLGFDPVDRGRLHNARQVEEIPFTFFPEWRFGFVVSVIVWILVFFITLYERQLCGGERSKHTSSSRSFDWSTFDTVARSNVSMSCAGTALILLALCYLPGVIAAYVQLVRGTKYSEFPRWLDRWLKGRKHLGILMLVNASIHVLLELSKGTEFGGGTYDWRGPTFLACGALAFTLSGVLGIASLPSVAASMTWREFSFVQSRLGWLTLLLASFHLIFKGWDALFTPHFTCYFPSVGQFLMVIPLLTLVLKLPLLLPCVDSALTSIRQGYERVSVSANV